MTRRARWITALCGASALLACPGPPPPPPAPPPAPPPELRAPAPCERIVAIAVSKHERRLRASCEGGAVVELQVALGRENGGPKRHAGDSRTPEGRYRISGPPRPSRFHRFIPIDYPSMADAATARAEGRLSEADYRRIAA